MRLPHEKERIYGLCTNLYQKAAVAIRQHCGGGWDSGSLFDQRVMPIAWMVFDGLTGWLELMQNGLIALIDDTPEKPLPITKLNAAMHGLPNDKEVINRVNAAKGKHRLGWIPSITCRRTKEYLPFCGTRSWKIDLDGGNENVKNCIDQRLVELDISYASFPSYSCGEVAKAHFVAFNKTFIPDLVLQDSYESIIKKIVPAEYLQHIDMSQKFPHQLMFTTAVRRCYENPRFAPRYHFGRGSWSALMGESTFGNEAVSRTPGTSLFEQMLLKAGGPREPRDPSPEMDLVRSSWPLPVSVRDIQRHDRHVIALCSCLTIALRDELGADDEEEYLRNLARNLAESYSATSHTYEWLRKQLAADRKRNKNAI